MPVNDMKEPVEPVNVVIGRAEGLVVLNVVGMNTGWVYWHLKLQPRHARDMAASLTWNSMQAEEENIGGGSETGSP
jgi:hypothetical protein